MDVPAPSTATRAPPLFSLVIPAFNEEAIGGYDETRLFGEDVDFLWRLRRLGKTRGQRLFRETRAKAIASTRKFDKYGDWHYFTEMPRLAWRMLRDPTAGTEFASRYWYKDR